MRAFRTGFVGLALFTTASLGGCDAVKKVQDCAGLSCKGSIAEGSLEITGNLQIDSVLRGVGSVSTAVTATTGTIETEIRGMCSDLGIADCSGDLGTVVGAVNAELSARFDAAAELTITYQEPRCEANVQVAVEATARCEAEIDPGEVSLTCEGQCSGSCDAECTGDFACEIEAPTVACSGRCEGTCQMDGTATCEGTCNGTCEGTCSLRGPNDECRGRCEGNCTGSCEIEGQASCSGTCTGKCLVDPGSAECTGSVSCRGECSGSCSGSCEGTVEPPSASVECQASARAEASASLTCTPPEVKVEFALTAEAEADGALQAELTTALASIKARFGVIVAAVAKAELLVDATADLSGSVGALVETDVELDIALVACLADQVPDAVTKLAEAGDALTTTATATGSLTGCVSSSGDAC